MSDVRGIAPGDTVNVYGSGRDVFLEVEVLGWDEVGLMFVLDTEERTVTVFRPWARILQVEKVLHEKESK